MPTVHPGFAKWNIHRGGAEDAEKRYCHRFSKIRIKFNLDFICAPPVAQVVFIPPRSLRLCGKSVFPHPQLNPRFIESRINDDYSRYFGMI
jgi:hypothetical protein